MIEHYTDRMEDPSWSLCVVQSSYLVMSRQLNFLSGSWVDCTIGYRGLGREFISISRELIYKVGRSREPFMYLFAETLKKSIECVMMI